MSDLRDKGGVSDESRCPTCGHKAHPHNLCTARSGGTAYACMCMSGASTADHDVVCSCYGCTIERGRAGIPAPDRSKQPCNPQNACATHGRCWIHSEWIDEATCDPPNACVDGIRCGAHCQEAQP